MSTNTRVTDLEPSDIGVTADKKVDNGYDVYGNSLVEVATPSGNRKLTMNQLRDAVMESMYPVGSIYQTTACKIDSKTGNIIPTNPNALFGFGTWRLYGNYNSSTGKSTGAACALFGQGDTIWYDDGTVFSFDVTETPQGNIPDNVYVQNNVHWGWTHITKENFTSHTHRAIDSSGNSTVKSKWVKTDPSTKKVSDVKDVRVALRPSYGLLTAHNIVKKYIITKRNLGTTTTKITKTSIEDKTGDPYATVLKINGKNKEIKNDNIPFVTYSNKRYVFTTVPEMKSTDNNKKGIQQGFQNANKWIEVIYDTKNNLPDNKHVGTLFSPALTSDKKVNWNASATSTGYPYYNPVAACNTLDRKVRVKNGSGYRDVTMGTDADIGKWVDYTDADGNTTIYVYCKDYEIHTETSQASVTTNYTTKNYQFYDNTPSTTQYEAYTGNPNMKDTKITATNSYYLKNISTLATNENPVNCVHVFDSGPSSWGNGVAGHLYIHTTTRLLYKCNGYGSYSKIIKLGDKVDVRSKSGKSNSIIAGVFSARTSLDGKRQLPEYFGQLYFRLKPQAKQKTKAASDPNNNKIDSITKSAKDWIDGKVPDSVGAAYKNAITGRSESLQQTTEVFNTESTTKNIVTGDVEAAESTTNKKTSDTYWVMVYKWVPYVSAYQNSYLGRTNTKITPKEYEDIIVQPTQGMNIVWAENLTFNEKINIITKGGFGKAYGGFCGEKLTKPQKMYSVEGDIAAYNSGEFAYTTSEDTQMIKQINSDNSVTNKTITMTTSQWKPEDTGYDVMSKANDREVFGDKVDAETASDSTNKDMIYPDPYNSAKENPKKHLSQVSFSKNSSTKQFGNGSVLAPYLDPGTLTNDAFNVHYGLHYCMIFWPGNGFTSSQLNQINSLITAIDSGQLSPSEIAAAIQNIRNTTSVTSYVTDTTSRITEVWPQYPTDTDGARKWSTYTPDNMKGKTGFELMNNHTNGTIVNTLPPYSVVYRWIRTA